MMVNVINIIPIKHKNVSMFTEAFTVVYSLSLTLSYL